MFSKFECTMDCCCQALVSKLDTLLAITFPFTIYIKFNNPRLALIYQIIEKRIGSSRSRLSRTAERALATLEDQFSYIKDLFLKIRYSVCFDSVYRAFPFGQYFSRSILMNTFCIVFLCVLCFPLQRVTRSGVQLQK